MDVRTVRTSRRTIPAIALSLFAWACASAGAASPVTVSDAWSHAATAGGNVAVYATIVNTGDTPDRLIGATSPSAPAAEIHDPAHGTAPAAAVAIPAHGTVTLSPGGPYVTFSGLKADVASGGLFFARLHFETAGWVVAIVRVRDAGTTPAITSPNGTAPLPADSSRPVIPVPVIHH